MNILFKIMLVAEVLILFSFPSLMLIGVIFSEKFWVSLLTYSVLYKLAYVMSAITGLVGVLSILTKIIFPKRAVESPMILWLYLLSGVIAVLIPAYGMWENIDFQNWAHLLLFVGPLLGVVHLAYLGRGYMFQFTDNKSLLHHCDRSSESSRQCGRG